MVLVPDQDERERSVFAGCVNRARSARGPLEGARARLTAAAAGGCRQPERSFPSGITAFPSRTVFLLAALVSGVNLRSSVLLRIVFPHSHVALGGH